MKWWQIGKRDADLERELQSDLQLEEEEQREHGIAPEEARFAALRAFGNPSVISEQTREVWSWDRFETLLRDLRILIRTLARQPGFSAVAMLVIAVGIGATVSLFTVVWSVLLKPLPFDHPAQLVRLYE
ncbi:MAG: permease prefix domain 1-containing protein, partial [Blastocatellia bacterium]